MLRNLALSVLILLLFQTRGEAQLETRWIDTTTYGLETDGPGRPGISISACTTLKRTPLC